MAGFEAITRADPAINKPARYDFDDRVWYVDLPGRLDEVSGLAFTSDGRNHLSRVPSKTLTICAE